MYKYIADVQIHIPYVFNGIDKWIDVDVPKLQAAERLRQMPQDLQLRAMQEDLSAARNPTAALQARMNELQNESIAQVARVV